MSEFSNFQVGDIVTFAFTDQERVVWDNYLSNRIPGRLGTAFTDILRYPDKPAMIVTPVETINLSIAYEDPARGISVGVYRGPGVGVTYGASDDMLYVHQHTAPISTCDYPKPPFNSPESRCLKLVIWLCFEILRSRGMI